MSASLGVVLQGLGLEALQHVGRGSRATCRATLIFLHKSPPSFSLVLRFYLSASADGVALPSPAGLHSESLVVGDETVQ